MLKKVRCSRFCSVLCFIESWLCGKAGHRCNWTELYLVEEQVSLRGLVRGPRPACYRNHKLINCSRVSCSRIVSHKTLTSLHIATFFLHHHSVTSQKTTATTQQEEIRWLQAARAVAKSRKKELALMSPSSIKKKGLIISIEETKTKQNKGIGMCIRRRAECSLMNTFIKSAPTRHKSKETSKRVSRI